jgi:hypothetical protein
MIPKSGYRFSEKVTFHHNLKRVTTRSHHALMISLLIGGPNGLDEDCLAGAQVTAKGAPETNTHRLRNAPETNHVGLKAFLYRLVSRIVLTTVLDDTGCRSRSRS